MDHVPVLMPRHLSLSDDYELVDVGDGRRLERFAQRVLDRPLSAGVRMARTDPSAWRLADARFERASSTTGSWRQPGGRIEPWPVAIAGLAFELRLAGSGQVGVFPEQVPNWEWVRERIRAIRPPDDPPEILNLFAYTGGSTLAAASEGATVVHVDAARSALAWARRNAEINDLAGAAIRWIVDDVARFVARELRRGRRYGGIILDPPSYGHGPAGGRWQLKEELPALLAATAGLLAPTGFLLLTAHTPGFGPTRLAEEIQRALVGAGLGPGRTEAGDLIIEASDGRTIRFGTFARWCGEAG